jgi:hypothetical protein
LGTGTGGAGSVVGGSTVGFATDRSGRGRNITQATANNRPAYVASWTNGRGALTFNGTTTSLNNATVPLSGANPGFSFFAVFSRAVAAGGALGCYGLNVGDWFSSNFGRNYSIWFATAVGATTVPPLFASSSQVTATPTVIVGTIQASYTWMMMYRRNGTVVAEAINATPVQTYTPVRSITVGTLTHNFGAVFHNGNIGEIGFYDRGLTDAESISLGRVLGQKWGITVA